MIQAHWTIAHLLLAGILWCHPDRVRSEPKLIQGHNINLGEALQFLREYDHEASGMCFRVTSAQWTYATNMTDLNKRRMIDEQTLKAKFDKVSWNKAVTFDWTQLPDQMARRQLKFIISKSRGSLKDDKYNEIYHLIAEMKETYSQIRVCPMKSRNEESYCNLDLDDVSRIMAYSRNTNELLYVWQEFHNKVGPPLKNKFMRYVQISNLASRMIGFVDTGEEMRYAYEEPNFEAEIARTFDTLLPMYKELFTYVRRKLVEKYGPDVLRDEGPIPAHLLGNLWAQDWSKIFDIVAPYPEFQNFDVTNEMLRQGFTPLRMFQMAEEFFTSLGLKPMPPEFWRYSMIERPNDRKVQCTASAWDFCNTIDFRIKQCTEVNMDHLITIHHEMAHIQYYLNYVEQPYIYRDGANPAFHEGVSNAILLSVFNPVHFHRVGLSNNNTDPYESNISFLMLMALKKVAFAPFAYLVDTWRYDVLQNGVRNMNTNWWELRLRYQGIIPPVLRTENHFDAASKRHIPADLPYMQYYVALLLEFQIHEALCSAAGHNGAMHTCDIYRSREAGRLLSDVLKLGRSRHWTDVMRMITRGQTDRLSAEPLLEYFQPLLLWLRVQNRQEKVIGWTTNLEEASLFQHLFGGSSHISSQIVLVMVLALLQIML